MYLSIGQFITLNINRHLFIPFPITFTPFHIVFGPFHIAFTIFLIAFDPYRIVFASSPINSDRHPFRHPHKQQSI
jgi:hypothetical protein